MATTDKCTRRCDGSTLGDVQNITFLICGSYTGTLLLELAAASFFGKVGLSGATLDVA